MPDIIDDVEDTAEDILGFTPKPDGLIDRHRKERARREEAQKQQENIDDKIESRSYTAIKVAQQMPEVFSPNVVTIQPGGVAQLLPISPYRYRATLLLATAASNVVLCKDQGAAISANGITLATGTPFPVNGRGQLWGFNPGGAAIQVGTLAELYSPEEAK